MAVIKRLVTTVSTSFDWIVSQLENHEALVAGAIKEMQVAGRRAKVQLSKVRSDGQKIRTRLLDLKDSAEKWEERAKRIAATDKEKALECIKRRNALRKEIDHLEVHERGHSKVETQLTQDLGQMELRIEELKRKKNQFAARETRQIVLQAQASDKLGLIGELDDIFERWDDKIAQCEPVVFATDDFDKEFSVEEEQEELSRDLEQLIGA